MSEFSDAYYLLDADPKAVTALLRKVRRFAVVFPADRRWTPVLLEGPEEAGGVVDAFADAATGRWMHYAFAEDHGLWLRVFEGREERLELALQRRGPSEVDVDAAAGALESLGILAGGEVAAFREAVAPALEATALDLEATRGAVGAALGVTLLDRRSCADLTYQTLKALAARDPEATLVLKSRRWKCGEATPPPEPNEACPVPGLPAFMYRPVPDGDADPETVARHVRHFVETGDFDNDAQEGFWMYTAYRRALPTRYRYLAERAHNLAPMVFPDWESRLSDTVRAILAVADSAFDFEPYLARKKGGQRI